MAIPFDTLKFAQTLEEAGWERKQADAITAAVRDSRSAADVATTRNVEVVRHDDLMIKLGTMLIVGFGTVIGLLLKLMG